MKYVISFTICLFSTALVHGQTVPKKPKKRAKQPTTMVAKPVAPTQVMLDTLIPRSYPDANLKKLEEPTAQKANTTHSKPMSSTEVTKTPVPPSVFMGVRTGAPKEDETADGRKPIASGSTQSDFEENEVRTAKAKLATESPLKPVSVTLEATPFGMMPGERIVPAPTGQINLPAEVPQLSAPSDPKQDEIPVVATPQPVSTPVESGLTARGPEKAVEIAPQTVAIVSPKVDVAVDKMAIMTFEQKTKDLGRMRLGESRDHTFTFTNKGHEPVEIELMDVCPCTNLEWDKNPIPPGATSQIKARFNSQKVFPEGVNHEIEKVITIILKNTDPKNGYPLIEELKLKAFVEYQFQD
jgi:Protein of unknown function (DUF1573)